MSIATIEDQLQIALAAVITDWPIRWPNENWPIFLDVDSNNTPLDALGSPVPFIEAEVIGGLDWASVGPEGSRQSTRIGLFRIYLIAPQGVGRFDINQRADLIMMAFKRTTPYFNSITGERLTMMDARIDDNVAERMMPNYVRIDSSVPVPSQQGARYIRMISIPWWFEYYS